MNKSPYNHLSLCYELFVAAANQFHPFAVPYAVRFSAETDFRNATKQFSLTKEMAI